MVIISACVTSKTGKPLFSRQYTEMSRVRIEGLLSAFPKLMDSTSQHTFVETDNVRYVYQPMEKLFILLVTNKSSNIVEDLDTLQLLSLIVKDKCTTIDEKEAADKAFELMFAFDEVISMGYRDSLSLDQVSTILDMDSHEENLQKLIHQNKVEDGLATMRREQKRIQQQKKDNPTGGGSGKFKGISSKESGSNSNTSTIDNSFKETQKVGTFKKEDSSSSYSSYESPKPVTEAPQKKIMTSSLKLGGNKKKENSLLENLVQTGELVREDKEEEEIVSAPIIKKEEMNQDKVHIKLEEEIQIELDTQGGFTSMTTEGDMFLTINDKDSGLIKVLVHNEKKKDLITKTHPNIDKQLFNEKNVLALKSQNKPFPSGNPLKVLHWSLKSDNSNLPFSVTCWPSSKGSKGMSCTVEYELLQQNLSLLDIQITIPLPSNDVKVDSIENGTYTTKQNSLTWILDRIDSKNSNGVLEFSLNSGDENSFFPISVKFTSPNTISGFSIENINSTKDDSSVLFSKDILVSGKILIQ